MNSPYFHKMHIFFQGDAFSNIVHELDITISGGKYLESLVLEAILRFPM